MRLQTFLLEISFKNSCIDASLFFKNSGETSKLIILVYVVDIIVTGNDVREIKDFITIMCAEFACRELGILKYYLGVEFTYTTSSMLLSQERYFLHLLEKFGFSKAKPINAPMVLSPRMSEI